MGLNADYDRLEDFANNHSLIRKIMGVETEFGEYKVFSLQSIKDNVRLLEGETIGKINDVVAKEGYRLVNKKEEEIHLKMDTYALGDERTFSDGYEFVMGCGTQESGLDRGCDRGGPFGREGMAQEKLLEERVKKADEDQCKGVKRRGKK